MKFYIYNQRVLKFLHTKFDSRMMKGAKGESATLFSEEGYEMLFDALLPNGTTPSSISDNSGVFWFLDGKNIKHDGADPGTTNNIQFDEFGNWGYLILSNSDATIEDHEANWFSFAGQIHNAVVEFVESN